MRKYKHGILLNGVFDEMRGTTVLLPKDDVDDIPRFEIIGGATLIDAAYAAIEEDPSNVHCKELMANGLKNTLVLPRDISAEDLAWVIKLHNNFHGGQGDTVAQIYRQVLACLSLSVCLSACLSVCLSLPVCLSAYLSLCACVCLPISVCLSL